MKQSMHVQPFWQLGQTGNMFFVCLLHCVAVLSIHFSFIYTHCWTLCMCMHTHLIYSVYFECSSKHVKKTQVLMVRKIIIIWCSCNSGILLFFYFQAMMSFFVSIMPFSLFFMERKSGMFTSTYWSLLAWLVSQTTAALSYHVTFITSGQFLICFLLIYVTKHQSCLMS